MFFLRTFVAATLAIGLGGTPVHATVDSTELLRELATDGAELAALEQALIVDADGDLTELRAVDDQGTEVLIQLEQMEAAISPAVRSALGPLPRDADGTLTTEVVPPTVVYDAAVTDLRRIAATPEAMAPVADSSPSIGLLTVAAVSLIALGLATLATTMRRRDDAEQADASWSDGLTGLANRRRLDQDLASYRGGDGPTAAIMVDIDHFSAVNDTHGRSVGDDVLRQVATMLTHHVRYDDVVYRYGSEEFCILLPDASIDDARTVANRIVEAARSIVLPDSSNITISVGVADGDNDISSVVATADRAMFEAKQSGRDCAVTAAPAHA